MPKEKKAVNQDENVLTDEKKSPDKKKGYVEYCLPFMPGTKEGEAITVTINGKNTQVQYGVTQMIPKNVADILDEMVAGSRIAARKAKELAEQDRMIAKID